MMTRHLLLPFVSISLLAVACIPFGPVSEIAPTAVHTVAATSTVFVPTVTPSGETPCSFAWATRDLPDLSARLGRELQSLSPAATGSAYAYGEDCVSADGTRTFSAMETDFQIQVMVGDLADRESLGDWIAKVMSIILALPTSDIQGPRAGRAEFEFRTANSESRRLNVNVDEYKAKSGGLTGARLFEMLDTAP